MELKNNKLNKRHLYIIDKLKEYSSVKVDGLSKELSVSPITIRRDLQLLEDEGLVKRFHGGATIINSYNNYFNTDESLIIRNKLAQEAAKLVQENDTIFINSSSTAIQILKYLKSKRVTVITNNGNALNMNIDPSIQLILTGGAVYPEKNSMIGDFASHILSQVTADKCFLGVSSISADSGIGTSIFQETSINKMMLSRCKGNRIVIADSSKVGKEYNFLSADISMVSCLITDEGCDSSHENLLKEKGIEVIKVDTSL